jgi:integrase
VWLPVSIEKDLEFWRSAGANVVPDSFIFPSSRGTAINTNNFLFRVLKEAGKKAGIKGVTHQMLRRTRSTYVAQLTTVLRDDAGALHQVRAGECARSGRIARPSAKESRGFRTARELNPTFLEGES